MGMIEGARRHEAAVVVRVNYFDGIPLGGAKETRKSR